MLLRTAKHIPVVLHSSQNEGSDQVFDQLPAELPLDDAVVRCLALRQGGALDLKLLHRGTVHPMDYHMVRGF